MSKKILALIVALGFSIAGLASGAQAQAAPAPQPASTQVQAAAQDTTPVLVNTETSYYRVNAYTDNNCSKGRIIISPGYGSGYYPGRSSYKVNAVSEIWVSGGKHKRVGKNVCYNFGNQDRYFHKNFKNK